MNIMEGSQICQAEDKISGHKWYLERHEWLRAKGMRASFWEAFQASWYIWHSMEEGCQSGLQGAFPRRVFKAGWPQDSEVGAVAERSLPSWTGSPLYQQQVQAGGWCHAPGMCFEGALSKGRKSWRKAVGTQFQGHRGEAESWRLTATHTPAFPPAGSESRSVNIILFVFALPFPLVLVFLFPLYPSSNFSHINIFSLIGPLPGG